MPSFVAELIPVFSLILMGVLFGATGFLGEEAAEGLKRLVAFVALPAVLFGAFARVRIDGALFSIAGVIFLACGALGLLGVLVSRGALLPRPATAFLFQGFEAGMLGYALFSSFFGPERLGAFATADLGQVAYVFTVLMAQLLASEGRLAPRALLRRFATSPALIAIAAGLVASAAAGSAPRAPWAPGGLLAPLIDTVGSLTTPLVCIVVGFNLKDFRLAGALYAVLAVAARLVASAAAGTAVAFLVAPALGYGRLQSFAVLALFVLPPPFVIPVFRRGGADSPYISAVLSLHTVVSLAAFVAVAALFAGAAS